VRVSSRFDARSRGTCAARVKKDYESGCEWKTTMDRFERRKKVKLVVGVLAVAIGMSALVAAAIIYMARVHQ